MSWKDTRQEAGRQPGGDRPAAQGRRLLQESIEEYRRLNERLSDVLDIVEELLVPAVDRDEEKLRELLAKI